MEYPTKFNKYRRLKEREALSKSPSKDGFALSNGFPMPNSVQVSNVTLIPNTCSTFASNCTLTPVERKIVLQPSIYDSSSATFVTHCPAVDCKQEEGCYQRTDLFNQPCSLPNSLVENTRLLSYRLNDVVMKEEEDCEEEELPLNLTISSAKNQKEIQNSPSCRQQIGSTVEGHSNDCGFNTGRPIPQGLTENMIIEEHFQRSLGSSYFMLFERSSPSPAPVASSNPIMCKAKSAGHKSHTDVMNSVSGSVDDHFSKSLGDVWTKVKASNLPKELDLLPSSVDDHFAKALGEMWYKIQAEKDPSDSSNSPRLSPKTCPSSAASSFVRS